MTKAEKTKLQSLINKITDIRNDQDKAFKELQDMSRELNLPVYCSAESNKDQLINNNTAYTKDGCNTTYANRAKMLYDRYVFANGQDNMLMEFGSALAELGFWKE